MNDSPILEAPGAGLPWYENLFLHYIYYPTHVKKTTWTGNLERIEQETQKIIGIADQVSETDFQTRILIPRLKGMEDSSRFWSIGLTIDHLLITMKGMSHIALELAQGHPLAIQLDLATVKPKQENVGRKNEMIQKLQNMTKGTVGLLQSYTGKFSTSEKVAHPFFGKISSEGWVWVLGQHQSLHRKQIQIIAKSL